MKPSTEGILSGEYLSENYLHFRTAGQNNGVSWRTCSELMKQLVDSRRRDLLDLFYRGTRNTYL